MNPSPHEPEFLDFRESEMALITLRSPGETGAQFETQVGGFACRHPQVYGEIVRISDAAVISSILECYFTGPKHSGWCCDGIDEQDALMVDAVLEAMGLHGLIDASKQWHVDRNQLKYSMEAYILLVSDYKKELGVLLWSNSD